MRRDRFRSERCGDGRREDEHCWQRDAHAEHHHRRVEGVAAVAVLIIEAALLIAGCDVLPPAPRRPRAILISFRLALWRGGVLARGRRGWRRRGWRRALEFCSDAQHRECACAASLKVAALDAVRVRQAGGGDRASELGYGERGRVGVGHLLRLWMPQHDTPQKHFRGGPRTPKPLRCTRSSHFSSRRL